MYLLRPIFVKFAKYQRRSGIREIYILNNVPTDADCVKSAKSKYK